MTDRNDCSVSLQNGVIQVPEGSLATVKQEGTPFQRIDHIASVVRDAEAATHIFKDILGFELKRCLLIKGKRTGMISAELESNGIRFALCEGTEAKSQLSQLVHQFGGGVRRIALEVKDVDNTVDVLTCHGLQFDTTAMKGAGLTQAFSTRCLKTGLSFEIIHRNGENGFLESNVQQLFDQLETSGKY
jgi:methylmalonyl-CoA/ethylmalonyl-CoA epimerase